MTNNLMRRIAVLLGITAICVAPLALATDSAATTGGSSETESNEAGTGETSTGETASVLPAIVSYESYSQRDGRYFMGWQFSVDTAMTISQLGAHDADRDDELTNIGSTSVALYDLELETTLASAQIPEKTEPEDGFAYVELTKSVTVVPGRIYVVAAEISGEPYAYGGTISYGPGINYEGYAYKVLTDPMLPNYRGTGGKNYFGATFRVDTVATSMIDNPGPQMSPLDTELSFDLTAQGPEDAALTWTAAGLPSGLTIDSGTGQITGSPASVGSTEVTVTLTSDGGTSDSTTFRWTVLNSAAPTVVDMDRVIALEGTEVSIQVEAQDDDGALMFSATGLPDEIEIDSDLGLITGHAMTPGIHVITVTAVDTLGLATTKSFELGVVAVDARPAVESYSAYTGRQGRYFMGWQFTVDSELTISELGAHDSNRNGELDNIGPTTVAMFDLETKEILGRVDISRFAEIEDGFGYAKLKEPVAVVPGRTYIVAAEISGESYAFGGEITYGEDINFEGYAYKVGADVGMPDRLGLGQTNYFGATFRVATIPNPELVNPGNQATPLNEPATLTVTVEKPDGAETNWSATGLPSGLAINAETGEITGTPDAIGSSVVTVSLTNDFDLTGETQFEWTVLGEFAPTLAAIDDAIVVESDVILIQAVADLVGPGIYTATGLPAGLSIDEGTGLISGRAQPDGEYTIAISVADGLGRTGETDFQMTVLNWGVSPAISSYSDYLARTGNYYMGWQFSVDETMTITELGIHDANRDGKISNRGSTTVGIYNNTTGRPIAYVEIPAGASVEDGFAYGPLEESVVVEPGTVYLVAAQVAGEPYAYIGEIDFADGVNYEGYAYRSGSEPGWPNYQGTSGPYYFGATFRTSEPRPGSS